MFTDASSILRICRLPRSVRTNKLAVWGMLCTERAHRESTFLGNWAEEESGHRSITKGLKTLPITQPAKILWKGAPPACLTKIQQKRTCLQIPAQSRISFHSVLLFGPR